MQDAAGVDTSALGILAEEIERSLGAAAAALDRWEAQPGDPEALNGAHRALGQVRGALEVADVVGVPRVVRELESLFEDLERDRFRPDSDIPGLARYALSTIRRYLAAQALGSPQDMAVLSQVLQRLLLARGSDRLGAIELFRPDLSLLPPERPGSKRVHEALDPAGLQAVRARYQKGLLSWLRLGEQSGLLIMRSAIESVEAACDSATARAPWWVAAGLLDLLVEGALEPNVHVKRACSALDQWLRRVIDGAVTPPEQLMRELLYFLATSPAATNRAAEIRQAYRIDRMPQVDRQPQERAIPFMRQFQPLRDLERALERSVNGDASSLRAFKDGLEEAIRQAPQDATLTELLNEVLRAADRLGTHPLNACAPLAVEMATTLLFLQDVLSRWTTPDADLKERMSAALQRLRAAREGLGDSGAAGWASLFGAARRKAQDSVLSERLIAELLSTLANAEQRLNRYFQDPSSAGEELAAAQTALTQACGALQVAGQAAAAAAASYCVEQVKRYRAEPGAVGREDHEALAAALSGLHYYLEQLRFGPVDFGGIMARANAPESIYSAAAAQPGSGEPARASDAVKATVTVVPAAAQDGRKDEIWDLASDAGLLRVFIDEAKEVLEQVKGAVARMSEYAGDRQALATIRRSFHTLKGSSRMVQLAGLGDVCWEIEQALNHVLEAAGPADSELLEMIEVARARCDDWIAQLDSDGRARVDATDLIAWARRLRLRRSAPQDDATEDHSITIGGSRFSRTLFDVFLTEAGQILDSLDAELRIMQADPDARTGHEMFRLAHTLSGIAGTMRLDTVRDLAGSLESVIRILHEGTLSTNPEERELLGHSALALRAMIAQVAERSAPEPRSDLQAKLESMQMRLADQWPARTGREAPSHRILSSVDADVALRGENTVAFEIPARAGQPPARQVEHVFEPAVERRRQRLRDDVDTRMLHVFLEEASDLVPQIGQELHAWRKRPGSPLGTQALARLLHTLKGSARMAGAMGLGELIHSIETRVLAAAQLAVIPDSVFEALEAAYDRIGLLLERLSSSRATAAPQTPANAADRAALRDASQEGSVPEDAAAGSSGDAGRAQTAGQAQDFAQSPVAPVTQLRVQSDLIERLVAEAGEVAITRSRLESEMRNMRGALREMAENIARLRTQAREIEIQAESQMQSRLTVAQSAQGTMDPLEFDRFTRLQELTRFITESANDVATLQHNLVRRVDGCDAALASQARMTRVLQDALAGVRLVPFSSLSERLHRVVRLAAREAGKRVNLDIRGGTVELDRGVLDRIVAALEHLLRNAVAHGIETVDARKSAGKAATGEIDLEVVQEGNEVAIAVRDDGAGFDLERLLAKAIAAGLTTADKVLSEREVAQFAFVPGVSTVEQVTEAAGRGVGLDVVRSEVASVGGRVDVAFEQGKGTDFTLHLPLVVSVMQVLLVRCDRQLFAIPSAIVEQTRTVDRESFEQTRAAGRFEWRGHAYPVHDLGRLLGLGASEAGHKRRLPLVLVKAGTERVAIQVEELVAHQEVVVKNVGIQVARVAGVSGAAVIDSGEVVLILNPVLLTQRAEAHVGQLPRTRPAAPPRPAKATVIVVDDSVTMRRITSRVLSRQGFDVVEARDGVEALSKLETITPDVLLLDIEMPRMDGFELLRRMRGDARWRDIPVIVISSRTADKHREYAAQLGVAVFLGKPFEEHDLVARVAGLVTAAR